VPRDWHERDVPTGTGREQRDDGLSAASGLVNTTTRAAAAGHPQRRSETVFPGSGSIMEEILV